jgi:hypothetical protein
MKNFKIAIYIMTVLLSLLISCKREKSITLSAKSESIKHNINKQKEDSFFEKFIHYVKFDRFEADGISLNEAITIIEERLNESWYFDDRIISINNPAGENYNPKIVIVLGDATIAQILDIISIQTNLGYKISSDDLKIEFYNNTDYIRYGNSDEKMENVGILPPLGPLEE